MRFIFLFVIEGEERVCECGEGLRCKRARVRDESGRDGAADCRERD